MIMEALLESENALMLWNAMLWNAIQWAEYSSCGYQRRIDGRRVVECEDLLTDPSSGTIVCGSARLMRDSS